MTTGGGDSAVEVGGPGIWEAGIGDLPASWDLEADSAGGFNQHGLGRCTV